jgi:hypothetical protein
MIDKFYHGTSTFFLDSIREKGLGTINPNFEFKFLELLLFLFLLAENILIGDNEYLKVRNTTKAMAFQEPFIREKDGRKKIFNFRHKNIYVSYGEARAVIYAVNTEFGSEILSRLILIYRLLKDKIGFFNIPSNLDLCDIDAISHNKFEPILVLVDNLTSEELLTEYGESSENSLKLIKQMKNSLDFKSFHDKVQFINFELLNPIEPKRLKFYKVLHDGLPYDTKFNWELKDI